MPNINKGRYSAGTGSDGVVLFLIGMRINRWWQPWKWLPVFIAMPRMLVELQKNRHLGLVGRPRTFVSGRTVMVVQYWESFEKLTAYSRAADLAHLPAWKAFNKKIRADGSVGIFHETIVLSDDSVEAVYANMPVFGLAQVTGAVPVARRGQSAAGRMQGTNDGDPPVEPY